MTAYDFSFVKPSASVWQQMEGSTFCTVFHTEAWFLFLQRIHRRPSLVEVSRSRSAVG